jgi:aryl-alcohol dehydrogenase-like predicted oxidoreductase
MNSTMIHRKSCNRREVLCGLAGGLSITSMRPSLAAGRDLPYRALGTTGERVSLIGVGGAHIGKQKEESESIRIIRTAIDRGVNFMDNCWDYNDGQSEIRMGKALRDGYRKNVFLMSKVDGRTKESAATQIDESLRRLQTDHVDLMQLHEVIRFDDPDRFFAPGGALEAFLAARKAGKLRYIGFTGHKDPDIHLYMLKVSAAHKFRFDTVQMPVNVMDAHFRSFTNLVLPGVANLEIGVLGMKSMGDGVILKSGTATPTECLHFAMSQPVSVVITGIDSMPILDQAIEAARTFRPMSKGQIAALLSKTAKAAADGQYELFKTSAHFDSTAAHPEWLGGETEAIRKLAGAS